MTGLSSANVLSGNAIINDGGYAITIGQNLLAGTPSGGLTKQTGAGTLTLSGANTYTGATTISAGTMSIGADNNLGATPGSVTAGNVVVNGGALSTSATFVLSANRGLAIGPTSGSGNGTLDVASSQALTYNGIIANNGGTGSLIKTSTGTLTLGGANTYSGNTTVSAGTLALGSGGSIANTPQITLTSGAVLDTTGAGGITLGSAQTLIGGRASSPATDVNGNLTSGGSVNPGGTGTAATLTITGNYALTGGTNYFDLSGTTSGANDTIAVSGTLNLSGTTKIAVNFTATPAPGRYHLITYSSKTGGTAAANLVSILSGISIGTLTATLDDSLGGIDLVLSSAHTQSSITWLGDGSANNWDTSAINWTNLASTTTTAYFDFDYVTFDNTATNPTVNLAAALNPASSTVNSTNSYTFSGIGNIAAGSLTKSNTGSLLVLTTNTYSGTTVIQGGTVQVGNGTASGALGNGNITNNSALVFNLPDTRNISLVSGTGSFTVAAGTVALGGNSTLNGVTLGGSGTAGTLDLKANTAQVSGLTLASGATGGIIGNSSTAANAVLNYTGGTSTFGGTIQDVLGSGTKTVGLNVTNGSLTLSGTTSTYSGGTIVGGGTLAISTVGNGQVGNGSVTITNGATLSLYRATTTDDGTTSGSLTNALVIPSGMAGTILNSPRGSLSGSLTGSGTLTLRVNASRGDFTGNWNAFTGQVNLTSKSGTSDDFRINLGGTSPTTYNNLANLKLNMGVGVNMYQSANPPSGGTTTQNIGELSGSPGSWLQGNPVGGRYVNWSVGALNTDATFAGNIIDNSGAAKITKAGTGTWTLTGTNISFSGGTTISAGTLQIGNGGASGGLGAGNVTDSASLVFNRSDTALSYAGAIGGAGTVSMQGGGTVTLSGANNYSGSTIIRNGTLAVSGGTLGASTADIQIATNAADNGTLSVSAGTVSAGRVIIAGSSANNTLPGTGAVTLSGSGIINSLYWFSVGAGNVSSSSSAAGTLTVSGGTLNVQNTGGGTQMEVADFAGSTGSVTLNSGAINIWNNAYIALGANTGAGNGTFTQNGGTVTYYSDGGTTVGGTGYLYLGRFGAGAYGYNLNGGTLTVPQIASTAGTSNFKFNGGTLKAAGNSANFITSLTSALVSTGGATLDDGGFAVTNSQPLVHDSALGITVDGGITKAGSGTLTLAGASTYTGGTAVSSGNLKVNNTTGSGTGVGAVSVASGATLGGSGTISGPVTFASGALATLNLGSHLTLSGTLTASANVVHLNMTNNVVPGTYLLATYDPTGSSGSFAATPVLDSGTLAVSGTTATITTTAGQVNLVVPASPSTNVLTASMAPSGYQGNVTFTATLTGFGTPTGTVQFLTNSVNYGSPVTLSAGVASTSLATLPRGTNLITAVYSGDVNNLTSTGTLDQIVTNHPPVAAGNTYGRNHFTSWKIAVSELLTNASDVDLDTLTLVSVGTSTNGVTLDTTSLPGYVAYYNANHVADQFTYTVTDGFGGTNTATITLTYTSTNAVGGSSSIAGVTGTNPKVLTAAGIPNYNYITERSTNLMDWVDIGTNAASTNGAITITDYFSDLGSNAPASAYYRLKGE